MPTVTEPPPTITTPIITERVEVRTETNRPWKVILYNDDWHAFPEVVMQVQRATGCSLEMAEWITHEAHTRGRAVAYEGTQEDCNKVASVLRQIRLQVDVEQT
ncbi:MAG TPA: ATP-dependent Clp protease adaptor ClpS [Candidatus Xenobia bacterium]|jgi:ATP-dependent Clp protease adapter protein ClpS